jgi:hypothetical protein
MKYVLVIIGTILITGCDQQFGAKTGSYTLFETSKGTVYRLNTASGETSIIYSPEGWPKLMSKTLYKSEDGKTYEYLGGGKLKELSVTEAADQIIDKYNK